MFQDGTLLETSAKLAFACCFTAFLRCILLGSILRWLHVAFRSKQPSLVCCSRCRKANRKVRKPRKLLGLLTPLEALLWSSKVLLFYFWVEARFHGFSLHSSLHSWQKFLLSWLRQLLGEKNRRKVFVEFQERNSHLWLHKPKRPGFEVVNLWACCRWWMRVLQFQTSSGPPWRGLQCCHGQSWERSSWRWRPTCWIVWRWGTLQMKWLKQTCNKLLHLETLVKLDEQVCRFGMAPWFSCQLKCIFDKVHNVFLFHNMPMGLKIMDMAIRRLWT